MGFRAWGLETGCKGLGFRLPSAGFTTYCFGCCEGTLNFGYILCLYEKPALGVPAPGFPPNIHPFPKVSM